MFNEIHMRKYTKIVNRIALILVMMVFITSCEQFTDGVGEFDPTLPTDASLGQVINAAEVAYIGFVEGELSRIAGIWSKQFTGTDRQYVALNNYTVVASNYDNPWGNLYSSVLKPYRIAQRKAKDVNNKRALAVAQILEAHTMGTAASLFGDIPYSQANDLIKYPNPVFDSQSSIYTALLTLLDDAIDNIVTASPGTVYDGDIFYGEDATDATWVKVANTIKAKLYLHIGEYQNAYDAALAGIDNGSADLLAPHGDSYNLDFNIYYSFLVYDRPGYMGATESYAARLIDPTNNAAYSKNNARTNETDRFSYIYLGSLADGYDLNVFGADVADIIDHGQADGFFSNRASFPIVTYRENQLILAESSLRLAAGGDITEALNALNDYRAYLDGGGYINPAYNTANGFYQPFTAADFIAGGIENPDGLAPADALYKEIVEERYVSLLGTMESFVDLHRKGLGSFASKQNWEVLGLTPNTGSNIPQRFLVAQSEINSNTSAPRPSPGLFDKTEIFQ
jgi:hypothetical protein